MQPDQKYTFLFEYMTYKYYAATAWCGNNEEYLTAAFVYTIFIEFTPLVMYNIIIIVKFQ